MPPDPTASPAAIPPGGASFLVSGLVNAEMGARIPRFPLDYYPIDYPFFGVGLSVSGVGFNVARALSVLGNRVTLRSLVGRDPAGRLVRDALAAANLDATGIADTLQATPLSVVLHDGTGRRQVHCDLKDVQDASCAFTAAEVDAADWVVACNVNFSRPLLRLAKERGRPVATDVHVLSDPDDSYNRDFMAAADVLFLSDEGVSGDPRDFLSALASRWHNRILVMGRGAKGALMYLRDTATFVERPACDIGGAVNTVGAGDALFSAFLHAFAAGTPPAEALGFAQLFAALKIRSSGGAEGFPTHDALSSEWQRLRFSPP